MCDKIKLRQSYVYNLAAIFIAYKALLHQITS